MFVPMLVWISFVAVTYLTPLGVKERAEFIVGGHTWEECDEARDNVKQHGGQVALLAALRVKRIKAAECEAVVLTEPTLEDLE